ncbi:MAG TPA: hypothetical protein VIQ00_12850 [Chitinophagaceae bacterium]|jgi:hypothetical protein
MISVKTHNDLSQKIKTTALVPWSDLNQFPAVSISAIIWLTIPNIV